MTRTPYHAGSIASAAAAASSSSSSDLYLGLGSAAVASVKPQQYPADYIYSATVDTTTTAPPMLHHHNAAATTKSSQSGSEMQQQQQRRQQQHQHQMSKVLAHSTSLLANQDSYQAGMSSDSELTSSSATRHHHRPYSSQSRVYHAHPSPRNSHASSRVSHYSDSAASSYAAQAQQPPTVATLTSSKALPAAAAVSSSSMTHANHNPNTTSSAYQLQQHLSHQGSVTSSGSGGSVSSYLVGGLPAESPISPMHQQQQQRPASSGRQLPHRPFKQSMSIDHQALSQYHPAHLNHPHHQAPLSHQLVSPAHSAGLSPLHYDQSPADLAYAQGYATNYQRPGSQSNLPAGQMVSPQLQQQDPNSAARYKQRQAARNYRQEMEMMENQAANLKLYDNQSDTSNQSAAIMNSGLPPTASRPHSSSTSRCQLPPINTTIQPGNSMSVDQLHNQHQLEQQQHHHLPQYHPAYHHHQADHIQQAQPTRHHKQDLYASHQMASSPADWLPPQVSLSGQQQQLAASRGGQFKHTMSIDPYPMSQSQHYSPIRPAPNFAEHYRGTLGYGTGVNSPASSASTAAAYESPTHHGYQSDHQTDSMSMYHNQYAQDQYQPGQSTRQAQPVEPQQHDAQHRPKLVHQASSGSSNSQSGSFKSSNLEPQLQHTSNTLNHKQQQQPHHKQALLRKGYTSLASGLAGGSTLAQSESGELSSSSQAPATYAGSGVYIPQSGKRAVLRATSPSAMTLEATASSSSTLGNNQQYQHLQQNQHHHSGSSAKEAGGSRSESSTGLPNGPSCNNSNLTKKSNSATQLSMTGTKKRLGFRKKQVTSFSVHRSEEVAPLEARHLVKQTSSVSEGDSSMSGDSSSKSWSNSNFKQQTSDELASMSFIEGLGKGQMISRQGLASPYLGDIQLSLCDRRGNLEVEVIRARNLQAKTNKILPLTYVKLYLVKNRKCLAKAKTTLSNKRTLDPLFQQQLTFHEDYHGSILQSIIWGNFGKMDKKNFMGIAQISIDDLELSDTVIKSFTNTNNS